MKRFKAILFILLIFVVFASACIGDGEPTTITDNTMSTSSTHNQSMITSKFTTTITSENETTELTGAKLGDYILPSVGVIYTYTELRYSTPNLSSIIAVYRDGIMYITHITYKPYASTSIETVTPKIHFTFIVKFVDTHYGYTIISGTTVPNYYPLVSIDPEPIIEKITYGDEGGVMGALFITCNTWTISYAGVTRVLYGVSPIGTTKI